MKIRVTTEGKSVAIDLEKKLGGAYTYKGFLYLKCPSCGHTRGFCTKKEIGGYHCELCGAYHPFTEELKQLQVNCQCGRKFEYMTNKEEKMFDINCIDCGGPVAVNYNEKKEIYETIR